MSGKKKKGMKGDQLTIFRRALKWLRICKAMELNPINFIWFIRNVDRDGEFELEDMMAVYDRLHDEGYLKVCK